MRAMSTKSHRAEMVRESILYWTPKFHPNIIWKIQKTKGTPRIRKLEDQHTFKKRSNSSEQTHEVS
jgi:hypothetical protein